ncbi:hypothetical protein KY345_01775 [Candidatus Woesearchaeota archaeon]|nr:hypothetical protein [Candidatus Woesearchaeota archaeon]
MFEFLKKIFGKETEKASIKTNDLSRWFDEKTKDYSSEMDKYVKERVLRLDGIKEELEDGIKGLEEARIEDEEKIIPKVKSVVIAARRNYIKDLRYLIKDLEIDSSDRKAVVSSCKLAQERLDVFSQKTAKSYFTTQHLFHKPLEALAGHLKELSKLVKELNDSVKDSKIFKAERVKALISKLNNDIELLKGWKDSIRKNEEKRDELNEKIKNIDKEIEELKKTEDFIRYEEDIKKINRLKDELRVKSNEIFELIAPLQTAIKKYERIAMDNVDVLKNYISDVVKAFLEDRENILVDILNKIKEGIEKGRLELKDKKKDKTIKQIEHITKEKLEDVKKEYNSVEQKINEAKERIERNDVQQRQEELLKKKDKTKDEAEAAERDINEVKEMAEKIDIEKEKKEIVGKIKDLLDIEVGLE